MKRSIDGLIRQPPTINASRVWVLVAALAASGTAFAGNGAPSGAHYNLNIIGVPQGKTASMTGNSGHRIFVPLRGKASIWLTEGDFRVLDANGTDQDGAAFQLPAADADCDGNSDYSVYVRGLGAPGGRGTIQTCFVDKATGELLCQAGGEVTVVERTRGKQLFTNESKKLLTVVFDVDGDGDLERTPLFGDDSFGYAWDYTNEGLRLAQMRFYDEFTLLDDGEHDYNCTR
jgi:hypothetical protein